MNKHAAIDSNVLVGLLDDRDKWHVQAKALLDALKKESVSVIYFDCVLNETISVMARRSEEQNRSTEFSGLLDKLQVQVPEDLITWITLDTQRLYNRIVALVRQTQGRLNYHDALIAWNGLSGLETALRVRRLAVWLTGDPLEENSDSLWQQ